MLRILDKNKVPVKGLRKYSDLCIENSIELDDKTLTFSVPYRNVRSAIVVEGYIETKEDRFVVKEIEKSSEGTANITAQLDLESLEGKPFRTFRSEEQTIKAALQLAFTGTGWTVGECSVSKKRTLSMANVSALDVLKQALKTYRAEIKIDSKKQSIDIYPEIGSDKGVYFSDQLNLRKLTVQYSTWFAWSRRTESGEVFLQYGYSVTVNNNDYMFGGVVIGQFTRYIHMALVVGDKILVVGSKAICLQVDA